jgi:hypothetical protein
MAEKPTPDWLTSRRPSPVTWYLIITAETWDLRMTCGGLHFCTYHSLPTSKDYPYKSPAESKR